MHAPQNAQTHTCMQTPTHICMHGCTVHTHIIIIHAYLHPTNPFSTSTIHKHTPTHIYACTHTHIPTYIDAGIPTQHMSTHIRACMGPPPRHTHIHTILGMGVIHLKKLEVPYITRCSRTQEAILCLSVCVFFICTFDCLPACIPACISVCLPICLFV